MKKHYFLLLIAMVCIAPKGFSQTKPCYTDEIHQKMILAHPEILKVEEEFEKQVSQGLKNIDLNKVARRTTIDHSGNPDFWYDIPIVVHVIHNYDTLSEDVSDNDIFNALVDWNIVYAKENYDTASVVENFIPYIGNPHIRLHLAAKDPNGNPTKGITRRRNYSTYFAGDFAKFDDWPPTSYVNIWVVNVITTGNGEAAAYAYFPSDVTYVPFYDGVIADAAYLANAYTGFPAVSKTINHEMGHVFNLYHPWGATNNPGVACGDDGVDDTPPTKGHTEPGCRPDLPCSNPNSLYDTACATNNYKIYLNVSGFDSLVNYPDTTNTQNIMDYTYCARMFTKGQAARMHAALNSPVGGRNNLWSPSNLYNTGILLDSTNPASFAPLPDLKPIPEFSASTHITGQLTGATYRNYMQYFTFPNTTVYFHNDTWNDTLTSINWTFTNSAATPSITYSTPGTVLTTVQNSFADPGWVDLKITAIGNNSGDTTVDWPRAVFVANASGTSALNYYEEFSGPDTAQWPSFNYYNNGFLWQHANVGYYDNNSIEYVGYDNRIVTINTGTSVIYTFPSSGSPYGDFDDLFSIPMDLSDPGFANSCSLNYYYSGASRSSSSLDINDTLEIDYSTDKSLTWTNLAYLSKDKICNKGALATPYTPASVNDWAQMSINIPVAARTNYTVFRFRYRPSVQAGSDGTVTTGLTSSGNNFYMDRVFFSPFPAGVANVKVADMDVEIAPNPTNGDAYVVIKDVANAVADIVVTDITGKMVYKTSQQMTGSEAHILIPHSAISVPGMYLVQTTTGSQSQTRKLVVQ